MTNTLSLCKTSQILRCGEKFLRKTHLKSMQGNPNTRSQTKCKVSFGLQLNKSYHSEILCIKYDHQIKHGPQFTFTKFETNSNKYGEWWRFFLRKVNMYASWTNSTQLDSNSTLLYWICYCRMQLWWLCSYLLCRSGFAHYSEFITCASCVTFAYWAA